jgi:hypothetical protein
MTRLAAVAAIVVVASIAMTVQAALSKEQQIELQQWDKENRERRARIPVHRNTPTTASLLNAHLDPTNVEAAMSAEDLPPTSSDRNPFHMRSFILAGPSDHAKRIRRPPRDASDVCYFQLAGRWERRAVIPVHINWKHSAQELGVSVEDLQEVFASAARMWSAKSTGIPDMPTFKFLGTRHADRPSSFGHGRRSRDRKSHIHFTHTHKHDGLGRDMPILGGAFLWVNKTSGLTEEADMFVMLRDHKKRAMPWHCEHSEAHSHFHLRRTITTLLGHVLGLGHPTKDVQEAVQGDDGITIRTSTLHAGGHVMSGTQRYGEQQHSTLACGDKAGIRALYGSETKEL